MNHHKTAPYGSWFSPITAELVARSSHGLSQLKAAHGRLYWIEQFPQQKGRSAIQCHDAHNNITELTPMEYNVRTRVHEYGGGDYTSGEGVLYFCNDRDQRIYRQDLRGMPTPITPKPQAPAALRYADGVLTPNGEYLICVRETHTNTHDVVNEIVAVKTDGSFEDFVLCSEHDFYASPALSSDGKQLLYLCWDHPQMPWDGTELYLAELDDAMQLSSQRLIAGAKDEAVYQPRFSQAGTIYFVSDKTNWWNLYRYRNGEIERLTLVDGEMGYPGWVFGTNMYEFIDEDTVACIVNEKGHHWLGIVCEHEVRRIALEYDEFYPTLAVDKNHIYCIAANAASAPAIIQVDVATHKAEVLHSSSSLMLDAGYLSLPEVLEFPTENNKTAFANFYPPNNPHYCADKNERPPLIVICHGGPTSSASTALNLKIQYWTSRGFAVVDVNYGGSTGYGRAYRERLNGQWGIVDVEDCVNAAKYLVQQDRVDSDRLIIKGSSAGGLTTLAALTFYDIFAAGASYYGVADLEGLVADTHKFEAHYLETLVGPHPEAQAVYQARSPICHTEKLATPVIFLQGLEDKVVPPVQAEKMLLALDGKKIPHAYVTFAHEQHGFRDGKSIEQALQSELSFYAQIFSLCLQDQIKAVVVKHFPRD